MKKVLFLLAFGLPVVSLYAQRDHEPYLQKSFARGAVHELEAQTSGGNISVVGTTTGEARVEVYVQGNNGRWNLSREEIKQRLDEQYDLTVELQGNKLVAVAKGKKTFNWNNNHGVSISFRIFTPVEVSSHVRTSGGNLDLKDLSGNEDFRTSGGNIDAEHLVGAIIGRTSGGNVTISDSRNDIDLQTSGGNMDARNCEGKIQLETSGGNVGLRGVKGSIRATTSGGQVEGGQITGELYAHTSGGNIDLGDVSASLEASTSGGNIHVNLQSAGKYVNLSNSSGDITVQLPGNQGMDLRISGERVHVTAMNNFRGDQDEHHIRGTLNGGGIPVKVDGNGGSVHVSFK
ncbi:MAG TPA: DUF4097 family beta strand repeat-containing protein [Puia sp.]|uniref:DUF4097 family beta strand repeat-containing protein n=1 Tax=Puia sp. TaxID=2045100 RepID=UPI002CACAD1C|nr:DUF4097 family beta strand repeat-containing protein [Puia sp.]HVU95141.1 DUF4097 family beta strand repeat-containing protein [Puia sp.]